MFNRKPMTRAMLAVLCLLMAIEASAQAAFVKPLLSGSSKSSGASLTLSGSVSVGFGNDIFIAFAADPSGAPYTVTDNLGNLYTVEEIVRHSSLVEVVLFRAAAVAGGSLTSITVTVPTPITAKAAVAGEFANVGAGVPGHGGITNGGVSYFLGALAWQPMPVNSLAIGAAAFEQDGRVPILPFPGGALQLIPTLVGQAGTTGQGARTNVEVALLYRPAPPNGTYGYQGIAVLYNAKAHGAAGASGVYAPD